MLLAWLYFASAWVFAHSDGPQVTAQMALHFNPSILSLPNLTKVDLEYLWVPNDWVQVMEEPLLSSHWRKLISDPSKPGFTRLLIHPFDKFTKARIQAELHKNHFSNEVERLQIPQLLTESRSLYPAQSEIGKPVISPRLSITDGFGLWGGREKDWEGETLTKLITASQAAFSYEASQILQSNLNGIVPRNFSIQPDRMVVLLRPPNGDSIGMTFRDIGSANQENTYLYPGFASLHIDAALPLALLNGFDNEISFLISKDAPDRGAAWAEFIFLTGFVHSSPHSQNLLLETDELMRLTGKVVIRDLADLIPTQELMSADPASRNLSLRYRHEREALNRGFEGSDTEFIFRYSMRKGNLPDKSIFSVTEKEKEIEDAVLNGFVKRLSEMSGLSEAEILNISDRPYSPEYQHFHLKKDNSLWPKLIQGIAGYRRRLISENVTVARPISLADEEILQALEKIKTHQKISAELIGSKIILKAALIARLRNVKVEPTLIEKIKSTWNKHETFERLSAPQMSWIASALVSLGAHDYRFLIQYLSVIQSPVAVHKLIKETITGGIAGDLEALLRRIRERSDPTSKGRHLDFDIIRRLQAEPGLLLNQGLIEALYFYFSNDLSMIYQQLISLKSIPQNVVNDLLRRTGKSGGTLIERALLAKVDGTSGLSQSKNCRNLLD